MYSLRLRCQRRWEVRRDHSHEKGREGVLWERFVAQIVRQQKLLHEIRITELSGNGFRKGCRSRTNNNAIFIAKIEVPQADSV